MNQVDKFAADCTDSEEINPLVPVETIEKIKQFRNPDRRISTKSTVVSANLKQNQENLEGFDTYQDGLDIGEEAIDRELERTNSDLVESLYSAKKKILLRNFIHQRIRDR